MTRGLTTAVKNALATNNIRPVHLITIGFGTPINITDNAYDLTSSVSGSSVTYSSSSFLMSIPTFTEETDLTKTSLQITLSGVNQTFISTCLNENVVNDSVTMFRGLLDDNGALIADPFLLYKGAIDTFSINETNTESLVNLTIVSHWADFSKVSGRKTNNSSQQRFFSTDVGFDFSSQTVLDLKWGRA